MIDVLVVLLAISIYAVAVARPHLAEEIANAVRRARERPRFDAVRTCDVAGKLYEVVDPAWWRVDRWVAWWTTPISRRTSITFRVLSKGGIVRTTNVRGIEIRRRR